MHLLKNDYDTGKDYITLIKQKEIFKKLKSLLLKRIIYFPEINTLNDKIKYDNLTY